MNRKILMLTLILFTLLALPGQGQNFVEANYDKTEYQQDSFQRSGQIFLPARD